MKRPILYNYLLCQFYLPSKGLRNVSCPLTIGLFHWRGQPAPPDLDFPSGIVFLFQFIQTCGLALAEFSHRKWGSGKGAEILFQKV